MVHLLQVQQNGKEYPQHRTIKNVHKIKGKDKLSS